MYLRAFPHDDDIECREKGRQDSTQVSYKIIALGMMHLKGEMSIERLTCLTIAKIDVNLKFLGYEINILFEIFFKKLDLYPLITISWCNCEIFYHWIWIIFSLFLITWNKKGGLATRTTPVKSVQITSVRRMPQGSFSKRKESAMTSTGELNMIVVASPKGNSRKL